MNQSKFKALGFEGTSYMSNIHERKYSEYQAELKKLNSEKQPFFSYIVTGLLAIFSFFPFSNILINYFTPRYTEKAKAILEARIVGGLIILMIILAIIIRWLFVRIGYYKRYALFSNNCLSSFEKLLDSHDALTKTNDRLIRKADLLDTYLIASNINPKEVNFNGEQQLEDNQDH